MEEIKTNDLDIYQKPHGYFNIAPLLDKGLHQIFIISTRSIGKTFSTIKYFIENNIPFLYMRRTQDDADLNMIEESSEVSKVLNYLGMEYSTKRLNKKVGIFMKGEDIICYIAGLKTFPRSIYIPVEYMIFDEFIPEPHIPRFREEGMALSNAFETINRNRSWDDGGLKPLTMICLANSMNIASDYLMQYDLITPAEELSKMGVDAYYRKETLLLLMIFDSPISKKKEESDSLYKVASKEFSNMALKNKFVLNDFSYVKKNNLKDYKPVLVVGDLTIYQHKDNNRYYISFSKANLKNRVYGSNSNDLKKFRRAERRFQAKYFDGKIDFENYRAVALFEKYLDL